MGQNQNAQHQLLTLKAGRNKGAPDTGKMPLKMRWKVFKRDHFVCVYCHRRTIFLPVLVALSFRFPEDFPFPGQNQNAECHGVFWTDQGMISLREGTHYSVDNAVTACGLCHTAKNRFPNPVRWIPKGKTHLEWDGLASHLPDLCTVTKTGHMPYFFEWMKVIRDSELI